MNIEHIAIWTQDLERMRDFYLTYFNANSNDKYTNTKKGFSSYFIHFDSGARIELMKMDSIPTLEIDVYQQFIGLTHIAFNVGSEAKVDAMTQAFIDDGYEVLDGPRRTGDGYYESVVLDPEGNRLELTA
ncbi:MULTISPECIES: VOC family protein [Vibrio]|uniref:VOC family protein n=1 Tax=Vibrio cortegadensis TaxID=1328770 RepID=A0ABV4M3Z1_9VIBR